jgi:hypothetical protein
MPFLEAFGEVKNAFLLAAYLWWVWLPIPLASVAWLEWGRYTRLWYYWVYRGPWIVLEVRIPKQVLKTPQAMEQIFSGIWSIITKGNLYERKWLGRWIDYMSLELVGTAGETHFYFCVPRRYREMMESYVYSEYPDAEIAHVEDYFSRLPERMPAEGWGMTGTELVLTRPDAYPIRTYLKFEDPTEERRIDPLSHFAEIFAKLGPDEYVIYQLVLRPADDGWKEESDQIVGKLIGRKGKQRAQSTLIYELRAWWHSVMGVITQAFFGGEVAPFEEAADALDGEGTSLMLHLSPGTRDTVENIELKSSKYGIETNYRMVFVGPEKSFNAHAASILSAMFGASGLFGGGSNGFRPHNQTKTWVDYFKSWREPRRKARLWQEMRKRLLVDDLFATVHGKSFGRPSGVIVLNVEELATVYHFPIESVTAPLLPRVEAKRGEPPVGLPVEL